MTTREERIEEYKKKILQCFPFEDPLELRDFLVEKTAFWDDSALFWRDEYYKLREVQK